MTVDQYIALITQLRQENDNIGFSMDLAHIFEHFLITQGRESESALQATLNLWRIILKKQPSSILSVDINNISADTKQFGKTHTGILTPGGAIPMKDVVEEYRDNLNRYPGLKGRIAIEPSPWQSQMLLDENGSAYLLSQIKPFGE